MCNTDFRCCCSKCVRCPELLYNYGEQRNGAAPCVARATWFRELNRARFTQMTCNAVTRPTNKIKEIVFHTLTVHKCYNFDFPLSLPMLYGIQESLHRENTANFIIITCKRLRSPIQMPEWWSSIHLILVLVSPWN